MATQPPPRHINVFNTIWRDWIYFFWEKSEKSGWQYLGSFDPTVPEELTGIPTTAVQVRVILNAVSFSVNSSGMTIELGDSTSGIGSGYSTSGISLGINLDGFGNVGTDVRKLLDGRYVINPTNHGAGISWYGEVTFSKKDNTANNDWAGSGILATDTAVGTGAENVTSGLITVPGALNKVKMTVSAGVFSTGTVDVWYQ